MPLKKRGDKKHQNTNLKKTEETSYLLPLRARRKNEESDTGTTGGTSVMYGNRSK